jgi:pyridoxamine 5'-phosphate oxidase
VSTEPAAEAVLREGDVAAEPTDQFAAWYAEAGAAGQPEPDAMCLATATPDGVPSARMVLLKAHDWRGFVFYSNEESRKGGELAANPRAALTWRWSVLDRQVRVAGRVEPASVDEADAYFASRARGSQIGAWASAQSRVLVTPPDGLAPAPTAAAGATAGTGSAAGTRSAALVGRSGAALGGRRDSRSMLEAAVAEAEARFARGPVPRPPYWVGYRVVPEVVEFWQGRASRLHDRIRYRRVDDTWVIERLSP